MTDDVTLSLSVVSHGQGVLVSKLFDDLARPGWNACLPFEVILTLNLPEDETWLERGYPFPLRVLRNETRKGFGSNHNAAFHVARGRYFAVVNPDIRLADFRLSELLATFALPKVGACGPLVTAPDGAVEDSARRFPTFRRLLLRKLLRQRDPDYAPDGSAIPVDWLAGMFLLFDSVVYQTIGGFHERYFMYLEDVEISRHLHRRGYEVLWVSTTAVIHDASRASRSSVRHLRWHLASLFRYFFERPRL